MYNNPFTQPPRPGTGDYNRRRNQNTQPNNNNNAPYNQNNGGFIEIDANPLQETKTMVTNNGNATWTKPADGTLEYLNEKDKRQNQLNNHQLDNEIEKQRLLNEDNKNKLNQEIVLAHNNNIPQIINSQMALRDQTHRHQLEDRQQMVDAGLHYNATLAQMADRQFYRNLAFQYLNIDLDDLEYRDTGISDYFRERLPHKTFEKSVLVYGAENVKHEKHEVIINFVDDSRDGIKFSLGKGWFAWYEGSLYYRGVYLIRFGIDPMVRKLGKLEKTVLPRNCCEAIQNAICSIQ